MRSASGEICGFGCSGAFAITGTAAQPSYSGSDVTYETVANPWG